MADLKPEIEKIFAKHEQHFHVNDNPGSIVHGERSPEKKKELESEYYNLKLNILESDETIEGSRIEELKDQIEDKLAVGANTIELMDQWWWERPSGRSEAVLRDVLRELKKHCPDEPVWV